MVKTIVFNGTTFKVGQNARENWALILAADKNYYWLHLSDVASAHVIIEVDVEPTNEEIAYAIAQCRLQTPKAPAKVGYICTQVRNLKLGSKLGEVFVR
jgi:predicted ribosome quality control (RQC) complex YloA/Tae2 family protein